MMRSAMYVPPSRPTIAGENGTTAWEPVKLGSRNGPQKENEGLLKAVSDLTLDKLILKEAARGSKGRLGNGPVDRDSPERAEP